MLYIKLTFVSIYFFAHDKVHCVVFGVLQAMYISVDPWGEYRRVHILPFADTLPTTYSFRLFEDYLQPFLKEQPWRLLRKGDIFTFRSGFIFFDT